MGATSANKNRKIRQEALRDQLSNQGHIQHIIEISSQLGDLTNELDTIEVTRLKNVADIKLKLINKYLPDLKAVEIEGEIDGTLTIVRKSYKAAEE